MKVNEVVGDVKENPEGERTRKICWVEEEQQALLYVKNPAVYRRKPRRRDLIHSSVSKMTI